MDQLFLAYLPIAIFIAVALAIGAILMAVPFLIAVNNPDPEKVSAYECGFNAFDDARMKFDVRYYLVAILFIIFDLEVAFLFPWAVAFKEIGRLRLLVDDGVPGRADRRLHLRVAEGSAGMGLITPANSHRHGPAAREAGRGSARSYDPRSQTSSPTRASSSPRRRPHQLGAHRLADVDDVRARLLRRRDDAGVHAALRSRALRLRAARLARASRT